MVENKVKPPLWEIWQNTLKDSEMHNKRKEIGDFVIDFFPVSKRLYVRDKKSQTCYLKSDSTVEDFNNVAEESLSEYNLTKLGFLKI